MSRSQRCSDVGLLHPFMQERILAVLEDCKKAGLQVKVFETLRTLERQKYLVENKHSWTLKSYHRLGLACDIVFLKNGQWSWRQEHDWDTLAYIAEKNGLTSGWRWTKRDGPHMELRISGYVADSLLKKLEKHGNLDPFYAEVTGLIENDAQLQKFIPKPSTVEYDVEQPSVFITILNILIKLFTK